MRVCAAPRVRPSEACHLGPPRGASRQACHAGGHAGRATQSRTLREFQRHPARKTARSTSSRRPSWGRPLLWGRLSSLRPAFQPAWVPFTHGPLRNPIVPPPQVEQAARLAMPAVTPAERPNPERYGSPNAIRPARPLAPPQPAPSLPISVFSVLLARRFFSAREDFLCRHTCLVAALPRCGLLFLRVLRVLCGLLFPFPPTPSHNLPQIFFPFLFNHLPSPPSFSSSSRLVC